MATKLLPKSLDDFAKENYWKNFFEERGENSFEWYGDYNELKSTLHRYIKTSDKILQVGCGNSLLADSLYDNGFRIVTSIDIVEDVIKNQKKRNRKKRPELVFQQADVTTLTYEDSSFNVCLDKGTLDALLPDETEDHIATINKMFTEITRCLTVGGRYLVISLAQESVLKQWTLYFSRKFLDEDLHIKLFNSENQTNLPRYEVFIVQKKENPKTGRPYAVFIVPQGREAHWHFASDKGRQEVCSAAECRRLAIIILCRGQKFESINQVKSELNSVALDFAPQYVPETTDVLYLSLGDDYLGNRSIKQSYSSEINGEFVVEDVFSGDTNETLRRLVFLSNQNVVQSEIQLIKEATEGNYSLDWNNLSCLHHRAIVASLAMVSDNFIEDNLKICLIGIGGGCLATFLRKHFKNASIVAVELDPVVIESAKTWFEFNPDDKLTCVVDDGVEFLKHCSQRSERFDVIIFDVGGSDYVEGLICPPPSFLTNECLSNAKSSLSPNGALAINLVCRDNEKSSEIKSNISEMFETVMSHGIADMVNHLLICLPNKPDDLSNYNQVVQLRLSRLYEYLAEICKSDREKNELRDKETDKQTTTETTGEEKDVVSCDEKQNLDEMFQKLVNL